MNITEKLATVGDEEPLINFDFKKLHEERVLADLKRLGYKLIKWEWRYEMFPDFHHGLMT